MKAIDFQTRVDRSNWLAENCNDCSKNNSCDIMKLLSNPNSHIPALIINRIGMFLHESGMVTIKQTCNDNLKQ